LTSVNMKSVVVSSIEQIIGWATRLSKLQPSSRDQ
jgi:hypothetical protein